MTFRVNLDQDSNILLRASVEATIISDGLVRESSTLVRLSKSGCTANLLAILPGRRSVNLPISATRQSFVMNHTSKLLHKHADSGDKLSMEMLS